MDSIGGNLDAFTAKELVCFNTKVLDEHLPLAFDVLADLVLHPLFREEDIEKEKGVILEEIKMEADSPDYLVHEIFSSNFWKDHRWASRSWARARPSSASTAPRFSDYYASVYTPSNLIVTAAGNLTHERLVALVREQFDALRAGRRGAAGQRSQHARAHRAAQQEGARAGASVPGRALLSDAAPASASPVTCSTRCWAAA